MHTSQQSPKQAPTQPSNQSSNQPSNQPLTQARRRPESTTHAEGPDADGSGDDAHSPGPVGLRRLVQLSVGLKPFQALEYDPATGRVVITTETLVATHETGKIAHLIAARPEGAILRIRRFPDAYKVTTISELTL
jgi:hypothetical protein